VRVGGAEQVAEQVLAGEVEELAFEGVKDQPAEAMMRNEPLVARDAGVPGPASGRWARAR